MGRGRRHRPGALLELVAADADATVLEEEILSLQARLAEMEESRQKHEQANEFLRDIFAMAERCKTQPVEWDEKVVRHFLLCVKVVDSGKLLVIFKNELEKEVRIS